MSFTPSTLLSLQKNVPPPLLPYFIILNPYLVFTHRSVSEWLDIFNDNHGLVGHIWLNYITDAGPVMEHGLVDHVWLNCVTDADPVVKDPV